MALYGYTIYDYTKSHPGRASTNSLRDHQYSLRDHQYGCRGGNRYEKGGFSNLIEKAIIN